MILLMKEHKPRKNTKSTMRKLTKRHNSTVHQVQHTISHKPNESAPESETCVEPTKETQTGTATE